MPFFYLKFVDHNLEMTVIDQDKQPIVVIFYQETTKNSFPVPSGNIFLFLEVVVQLIKNKQIVIEEALYLKPEEIIDYSLYTFAKKFIYSSVDTFFQMVLKNS